MLPCRDLALFFLWGGHPFTLWGGHLCWKCGERAMSCFPLHPLSLRVESKKALHLSEAMGSFSSIVCRARAIVYTSITEEL